jgi:hypothetical protein
MVYPIIAAAWLSGLSDTLVVAAFFLFLAAVLCLIVWGAWRAYTPRGFTFYFLMWGCMVFTGVCAIHSTWPSSAPRRQADGIISWIVSHRNGKSETYTLGLLLPGGAVLPFLASATPPFFAKARDLVAVTYLDEKSAGKYQRAIGFRVLTGPRAGFHDAVSADWLGPWLGVLLGPLCGLAALWQAAGNKRAKP